MTDRELLQQALDALEYAEKHHGGDDCYADTIEAIRARLSQCDRCGEVNPAEIHTCSPQEPVAWGVPNTRPTEKARFMMLLHSLDGCQYPEQLVPLYTAPPHFIDPAKVARLMDEAFERGKKEIDMEQVKDIAQKLADCALLNSAPPQREWQGLTMEETELLIREAAKFREGYINADFLNFAKLVAEVGQLLKEKNT